MSTPAVQFERVAKAYARGGPPNPLADAWRAWRGHPFADALWALQDVSLSLDPGDILGVIGPNGAGKSTLLKLMAGVTIPTTGRITLCGRVGSLIELGAGFHPELSGRDNVYLNGQIMGLSRGDIARRYDAIVAFAGLDDFMQMPVKRYSSGMYARLGFAVAAHLEPDILLVDEVLSVGDVAFQRRSLDRMLELVQGGRTVIFVSHNLLAVERLCRQTVWLADGRVQAWGPTRDVIRDYLASEEAHFADGMPRPAMGLGVRLGRVTLCDGHGRPLTELRTDEALGIEMELDSAETIPAARLNLGLADARGVLFLANMLLDGASVQLTPGRNMVRCRFPSVPLMPGVYRLMGEVWGGAGYDLRLPWGEWARLHVRPPDNGRLSLAKDHSITHLYADAPLHIPYSWSLD